MIRLSGGGIELVSGHRGGWGILGARVRCRGRRARLGRGAGFARRRRLVFGWTFWEMDSVGVCFVTLGFRFSLFSGQRAPIV